MFIQLKYQVRNLIKLTVYEQVGTCFEHNNGTSGTIKGCEFLDQLNDGQSVSEEGIFCEELLRYLLNTGHAGLAPGISQSYVLKIHACGAKMRVRSGCSYLIGVSGTNWNSQHSSVSGSAYVFCSP